MRFERGESSRRSSSRQPRDTRVPRQELSDRDRRVQPQPIGDKCNPLCPLFTCARNALFIANKPVKGRIMRVAQCRLIGGDCIDGECQYSSCKINALLPNSKCAKALEKKIVRPSDEEFFREMLKVEEYDLSDFK